MCVCGGGGGGGGEGGGAYSALQATLMSNGEPLLN